MSGSYLHGCFHIELCVQLCRKRQLIAKSYAFNDPAEFRPALPLQPNLFQCKVESLSLLIRKEAPTEKDCLITSK
jgi:hypothetical protein